MKDKTTAQFDLRGTIACCLLLLWAIPISGLCDDWPQWRGPERNGISNETDWLDQWPEEGPKVLWQKDVGIGCASMVVSEGKIYTTGNREDQDTIWSLDALTGKEVWHYSYPSPLDPNMFDGGPAGTPSVDQGRIYTISRKGDLICLNLSNGDVIWRKQAKEDLGGEIPRWGFSGSPLVRGERVYYPAGVFAALNKQTGEIIWKSGEIGAAYSSPVSLNRAGDDLLALFTSSGLGIFTADKGEQLASHPWKTSSDINAATPIVTGDEIFISSAYGVGAALLKFDGKTLSETWADRVMRNKFSSSLLWGNHVYGFDEDKLKCIELRTGEEAWKSREFGHGTLLAAGGKLIILSEKGELAIAQAVPDQIEITARFQVLKGRCWVAPVLSGGVLYVKNNLGNLVALDLRPQGEQ